jgi:4-amino-4-deoxy-L-arabinose transferase-like glycosyltransferase
MPTLSEGPKVQRRPVWRKLWTPGGRAFTCALIICFVFGIVARVLTLTGGLGELNSDEAVIGLMAMHLLDGEFSTFFWGQDYGGTLDVILAAPFVWLFGPTRMALQLVPVLQSIAATALVALVARRILGWRGGATAAAIFWSFPAAFVWWQTRPSLLYLPIVVLGLTIVLCVQRLEEDPFRRAEWLLAGVAAGVGWWTSPHVLYFLLPSVLWLLARRGWSALRHGWIALPAFAIGAGLWLSYNTVNGWPSVTTLPFVTADPLDRLVAFFLGGLPIALGAKVPFTEEWIGPIIGPILYLIGLAALIAAIGLPRKQRPISVWLLIAFPILFTLIPTEAYVGSGRYFIFLGPPVAIVLSSLPRSDLGRIALLAICISLTAFGLARMRDLQVSFVPEVDPLVQVLDQADVAHVISGFWVAYKLTWETEEAVIATPVAMNRYSPYRDEVAAADEIGYVYNNFEPAQLENADVMREALSARDITFEEKVAGGYTVIFPTQVILPDQLPGSAVPNP